MEFFRNCFAWSILFGMVVYSSLYVLDPLGYNYEFDLGRINRVKPAAVGFERQLKHHRIRKVKPKTLILGSSRVAYGVEPTDLTGFPKPVFNAALEYGQPFEMMKLLEYASRVAPLEQVFLFIQYFNFHRNSGVRGFDLETSKQSALSAAKLQLLAYFSGDALLGAFEMAIINFFSNHPKGSTKSGFIYGKTEGRFGQLDLETRFGLVEEEAKVILDPTPGLKILRSIVAFCKSKNVRLGLILGPWPPEHIALRKRMGTWEAIEQWKLEIRKISEFTDHYSSEANFDANDFLDRVHFSPESGRSILYPLGTQPNQ
jgi:hypothetical protein